MGYTKIIMMMVVAMLCIVSIASAENTVTITDGAEVDIGDNITLSIDLVDCINVGGFEITVKFDPTVVSYVNGTINSDDFNFLSTIKENNSATGEIAYYALKVGSGLNGDMNVGTITLDGISENMSALEFINVGVYEPAGDDVTNLTVENGSILVWDSDNPIPIVLTATYDHLIPDDTDDNALWGETALLSVTSDSSISTMTVDLTAIGGVVDTTMTLNTTSGDWEVTTNAVAGTLPATYDLPLHIVGTNGRINDVATVPLMVMYNGDTNADNTVNESDAILLFGSVIGFGGSVDNDYVSDVSGDGLVSFRDVIVLANHVYLPDSYTLR